MKNLFRISTSTATACFYSIAVNAATVSMSGECAGKANHSYKINNIGQSIYLDKAFTSKIWVLPVKDARFGVNYEKTLQALIRNNIETTTPYAICVNTPTAGDTIAITFVESSCTNKFGMTLAEVVPAYNPIHGHFKNLPSRNGLPMASFHWSHSRRDSFDCRSGVMTLHSVGVLAIPGANDRNEPIRNRIYFYTVRWSPLPSLIDIRQNAPTLKDYQL